MTYFSGMTKSYVIELTLTYKVKVNSVTKRAAYFDTIFKPMYAILNLTLVALRKV